MSRLFTRAFWEQAGGAVLRSVLAALVPLIPAIAADPQTALLPAILTLALVLVVTLATMLAGLPSADDGTWWQVAFQRAVRQFGQYIVGATGAAVLLTDVDWKALLIAAGASAVSTFVIAALSLVPSLDAAQLVTLGDDAQDGSTEGTTGAPAADVQIPADNTAGDGVEYEPSDAE